LLINDSQKDTIHAAIEGNYMFCFWNKYPLP
jgi:hypothetical protein